MAPTAGPARPTPKPTSLTIARCLPLLAASSPALLQLPPVHWTVTDGGQ